MLRGRPLHGPSRLNGPKLANIFPNSVWITTFYNKFISGPAGRQKIKTCHKNGNTLIADIKIHSRTLLFCLYYVLTVCISIRKFICDVVVENSAPVFSTPWDCNFLGSVSRINLLMLCCKYEYCRKMLFG